MHYFLFLFIIIIIVKTLFILGLERKIYNNEIITAKDKRVIHATRSKTSNLQARLRETSNAKNAKAPNWKRGKLAHFLLIFADLKPYLRIKSELTTINIKYTRSKQLNIRKG